ncbi:MAG: DUF167 domain-containing protein [Acidobacteriaceae bacterium]
MAFFVRDTPEGARFLVRVAPRASRTAITGVMGEGSQAAVKIALQAPPVEGRANAALIEFLADFLRVPRSSIEIAGGDHGRNKTIVVRGRKAAEIAALIEPALRGK